ncbi:haloacid dehalogenase type II [Elioraea tepidiphila]|uniref:haloacid dehalogenase type II n=1 Tax=Elioraea tepidiphila TaxID=457934 RepID=UPI00036C732E|nr:haloacid dehalogenase type II [Elioraea tepidiphila]
MSEAPCVEAVVFDAYGTLFDVHAAVRKHARRMGESWEAVGALWRQKQLEYAWVASLTGPEHWRDFEVMTRNALFTALNWYGGASLDLVDDLMAAYRALPAFDDARPALEALRAAGIGTAILSNGSRAMLAEAVAAAKLDRLLDHVLSVDAVRVYKPDPRVYRLAEDAFRLHCSRIGYVSANAWDAQAAAAYGFRTVWVNRINQPVEFAMHQIARMAADLEAVPEMVLS